MARLGGEPAVAQRAVPTPRSRGRWDRLDRRVSAATVPLGVSGAGVVLAVVFTFASLTPSLLPRTWLAQGLISGVAASIGYGLGAVLGWLWPRVTRGRVRLRHHWARWFQRTLVLTVVALLVGGVAQGAAWQHDLYVLMGAQAPSRLGYVRVPVVALLVMAAMVGLVRCARAGVRLLVRLLRRWLPEGHLQTLGVVTGVLAVLTLGQWVAVGGFLSAVTTIWSATNNDQGSLVAPTSPERSGSPESLVSWSSLGMEGRTFVAGGPTVEELSRFNGAPARDPIRVYAGVRSAVDSRAAAVLAVRELERTGAFSRGVLCVVTTTGTGWVDPYVAASLEYLHNGDTAIVGVQYSVLPSWLSYLSQRDKVTTSGRQLFDEVYAHWATLPAGHRPRLLVFAESLGSLGSEASFPTLDDAQAHTDGVLWAGPTNANRLWSALVAGRERGSPEVLPVYRSGAVVRFASQPADLARPGTPWSAPRVVYLQNPSDPVSWWSPSLILQRPGWLDEPAGRDQLPAMRWFPVVTFLQVTADLALAYSAPPGHGHEFHTATVAAWVAISPVPHWTPERSAQLARLLAS